MATNHHMNMDRRTPTGIRIWSRIRGWSRQRRRPRPRGNDRVPLLLIAPGAFCSTGPPALNISRGERIWNEVRHHLLLDSYYLGLRLVDIHAWVHSPLALNYLGGNGSDVTCHVPILISLSCCLPLISIVGLAASGQSVRPPLVASL